MDNDQLKQITRSLPENPGIYQFLDDYNEIIYIGKAKNLKNRVSSYFNKTVDRPKTEILVKHIADIKFIVVDTESDAFLLENSLIKKFKPRYNIQLKDDKSYPWIVLKNEPYPRVYYTRTLEKDGSEYYGPYTSVYLVRLMISMFKKLYKIRTCKFNLTQSNIMAGKFRACLQYHIKNCEGPCIGEQPESDYLQRIDQIRKILKGNVSSVINILKAQMLKYADELQFEKAQEIKEKLDLLENYQSKSPVVSADLKNIDVFNISSSEKYAYVNMLKVVNGIILQAYSMEIKKKLDESDSEILETAIIDIRENIQQGLLSAKEILVPIEIELQLEGVSIKVPQKGVKKELMELSEKNLKFYRLEKEKQRALLNAEKKEHKILEQMKTDLNLKHVPFHIECFDNSNLQGTNAVSSCVVFKNGKPSKKDYRKFNVKTVEGPDDFATMKEVIYRRYHRLVEENQSLPQLIVIDGGKGQLSAAVESLEKLNLMDKIEIISIAKKLEEIFKPFDNIALYLDKSSPSLKIIQQARDEAHRFGITFHRQKRAKSMVKSSLDEIKGVGSRTIEKLLKHFGGLSDLKKATFEEIAELIGNSKAQIVFKTLNKN